jgi:hypothetical protein
MQAPYYVDLFEARQVLADIGIQINERQMKRAAEPDHAGQRKLPFFKDPIDGRLKIERIRLISIYKGLQSEASENSFVTPQL